MINNHAALIRVIADLMHGDYKQSVCGRVTLPLSLLRRLDRVLEVTKAQVLASPRMLTVTERRPYRQGRLRRRGMHCVPPEPQGHPGDTTQIIGRRRAWIAVAEIRDVTEKSDFDGQIDPIDQAPNVEMGFIFADLRGSPDQLVRPPAVSARSFARATAGG